MSARTRVLLIVAAAAAAAAAIVVGATLATRSHPAKQRAAPVQLEPRKGAPPLVLDLGVRADPDSASAVHADDLLHPGFPRGLPLFVPSFPSPSGLDKLPPGRQLAELGRRARARDVEARLLYGAALQRVGRPVSAERAFASAEALAPDDPEAQVAAAIGRFSKEHPERAFSRLGPLARRFPHATTVRFHLGLLLLWIGQVDPARRELRQAV